MRRASQKFFGQQRSSAEPRVLGYHEFSSLSSQDVYQMLPATFCDHLHIAASHGTQITFDDAHRSQISLAAPALEAAGMRGLFFAPSAWVGARKDTAGWADLRALVSAGHSVGSHGHTHVLLTQCQGRVLRDELERSRALLEDKLGVRVDTISMPGGRWDRRVAQAALAAGYRTLYTSEPAPLSCRNINRGGATLAIRGRLVVRRTMTLNLLAAYAAQGRLSTARLEAEYLLKQSLKRAFGDTLYQHAWRQLLRSPIENTG